MNNLHVLVTSVLAKNNIPYTKKKQASDRIKRDCIMQVSLHGDELLFTTPWNNQDGQWCSSDEDWVTEFLPRTNDHRSVNYVVYTDNVYGDNVCYVGMSLTTHSVDWRPDCMLPEDMYA